MSCFHNLNKGKKFNPGDAPDFIMKKFSNFLNSYAKAYNKMYDRKGSLFMDYLRRIEINPGDQFCDAVFNIHNNPVHHDYTGRIEDWPWSSYKILLSNSSTDLLRKEVMDSFGGKDQFIKYHQWLIAVKALPL